MNRGSTGRFEVDRTSGESVQAFVPASLPPEPPIEMTAGLSTLHDRALLACGRLDGVSALLPDPDLFLYAYVRREALLSSQIEGTQSSISDLLLFELDEAPGVPVDDVVEVSNYVAALEHSLARLRGGFPLSGRLLCEAYGHLLARGRGADTSPGEFRTSQNWIGGIRPGNAHYVPPPPSVVPDCMASLERFIHADADGLSPLIRAGLAHVQFESIHPFLDGNGRIGRLLIVLILTNSKVLSQPLLYVSLYLKQHRTEYYRLLDIVRQEGDWEAWLSFFLEGVAVTAQAAVDTAHRLLMLFRKDTALVEGLGRSASTALRVYDVFRRRPLTTITALSAGTNASFPTVSRAIDSLIGLGIINEITGRKRERVFAYSKYLDILNEGTEPL